MTFREFLENSSAERVAHVSVVCFIGENATHLARVISSSVASQYLKKDLQSLSFVSEGKSSLMIRELSQSFLGQSCAYWLGEVTEKYKQVWQETASFIATYTGPHTVFFVINQTMFEQFIAVLKKNEIAFFNKKSLCIAINSFASLDDYSVLAQYFGCRRSVAQHQMFTRIFARVPALTFDTCYMLMEYSKRVGTTSIHELELFLWRLIEPSYALSNLSSAFFARDAKKFWHLWKKLAEQYPAVFWTTFWSTQLWQAVGVLRYASCGEFAKAYRFGSRLPAQVLKVTWQKLSEDELVRAHQMIHDIDVSIKMGSVFCSFEYFFMQWFVV